MRTWAKRRLMGALCTLPDTVRGPVGNFLELEVSRIEQAVRSLEEQRLLVGFFSVPAAPGLLVGDFPWTRMPELLALIPRGRDRASYPSLHSEVPLGAL